MFSSFFFLIILRFLLIEWSFLLFVISTSIRLTIFFFVFLIINIFVYLTIIVYSLLKNIIATSNSLLLTIFLFFFLVYRSFFFFISFFFFKILSLLLFLFYFNFFNFFFINYKTRYSRIFKYNIISRFKKLLLIFRILYSWVLFFYNFRNLAINSALFSLFLY